MPSLSVPVKATSFSPAGGVIVGLELAAATMKEKERSLFRVSYEYGYGVLGCPPVIPAKANLCFDVEMLSTSQPVTQVRLFPL